MKILASLLLLISFLGHAQQNPDSNAELLKQVKALDSAMFAVVYKCDAAKIESFFTDDLEFYHDKGGPTKSRAAFLENQKKNFCGEKPFYLRRETVPGTMQVFPMDNFGALQTGEHVFYIKDATGKEVLDGRAKYAHLWKHENNEWRLTRVISYDHGPAKK